MARIHTGQTWLEIILNTETDLSGCTAKIKYKKPSGKTGYWNATIVSASAGTIKVSSFSETTLDEYGDWTLWSHITNVNSKIAEGDPVTLRIYRAGEVRG